MGKHRRKCSAFECKILLEKICCTDCKTKENCRFACKNQPEKCGLMERKKMKKYYVNKI